MYVWRVRVESSWGSYLYGDGDGRDMLHSVTDDGQKDKSHERLTQVSLEGGGAGVRGENKGEVDGVIKRKEGKGFFLFFSLPEAFFSDGHRPSTIQKREMVIWGYTPPLNF